MTAAEINSTKIFYFLLYKLKHFIVVISLLCIFTNYFRLHDGMREDCRSLSKAIV